MIDAMDPENQGEDLRLRNSDAMKAGNVVGCQLGYLHHNEAFGCDLRQFIIDETEYSIQTYKAYVVQRLVEHKVSLGGITEAMAALDAELSYTYGGSST